MYALARETPYMDLSNRHVLMNAFFNSQLNYCPLVWKFHNRTAIRKLNRLQKRCLHIIHNDKQSSFEKCLKKGSCISIHNRSIQILK